MKYCRVPLKTFSFPTNLYPKEICYERGCTKIAQVEPPEGLVCPLGGFSLPIFRNSQTRCGSKPQGKGSLKISGVSVVPVCMALLDG